MENELLSRMFLEQMRGQVIEIEEGDEIDNEQLKKELALHLYNVTGIYWMIVSDVDNETDFNVHPIEVETIN